MIQVLDASALIAFFEREAGYEKVKKAMLDAVEQGRDLLMSVVNWGEVYYFLIRRYGIEKADQAMMLIGTFPIDIVPADEAVTHQASLYKALQKLPYADSFAAALSKIHNAELLTGDKEFQLVEKDIRILWV
jgi:predicted nucleic acid-binding protein